jgi:hypothetical protein
MRAMNRFSINFHLVSAMLLACLAAGMLPLMAFAQGTNVDASTIDQRIKDLEQKKKDLSESLDLLNAIEVQVSAGNCYFFSVLLTRASGKYLFPFRWMPLRGHSGWT